MINQNLKSLENNNLLEQIKSLYYDICYNYSENVEKYDTSFGLIPLDYKITTLNDLIIKNKDKVGFSNYKVLSAVNTGNLVLSDEYFNKQVFSKDISKYIIVKKGEFAYNPARINIGSIGINDFDFEGCVSPVYVAFNVQDIYKNFLRMFFKSKTFNIQVISRSNGSVRQTLNYDDFSIIELILPPENKIKLFNNLYDINESVIKHNKTEIERLTKLRDTLLPKLMSGEIDVSDINFD